jgi:hypothetical protein
VQLGGELLCFLRFGAGRSPWSYIYMQIKKFPCTAAMSVEKAAASVIQII